MLTAIGQISLPESWTGLNEPFTMAMGFLLALSFAILVGPACIRLARWSGMVDRPGGRKAHIGVIARFGGMIVYIGTWGSIGVLLITDLWVLGPETMRMLVTVWAAGSLMMFVGAIDDKFDLPAKIKLGIQLVVSVLVVVGGGLAFKVISVPGFDGVIQLGVWAVPLSVLWIAGVTNAINLVDGVDGLASGICLIISVTIGLISALQGDFFTGCVAACLAGSCMGFLRYNANPARVFLGDSGSLFIGMTLACLAMVTSRKSEVAGAMLIPILLLGYPALDTFLVMAKRQLRGKPVFAGDRTHIHHRLLHSGLNPRQTVVVLYAFCAVFCLLALGIALKNTVIIVMATSGLLAALMLGFSQLGYRRAFSRRVIDTLRPQFRLAHLRHATTDCEIQCTDSVDAGIRCLAEAAPKFHASAICVLIPTADNLGRRRVVLVLDKSLGVMRQTHPGDPGWIDNETWRKSDRVRHAASRASVRVIWSTSDVPPDLMIECRALYLQLCKRLASRVGTVAGTVRPSREGNTASSSVSGVEAHSIR